MPNRQKEELPTIAASEAVFENGRKAGRKRVRIAYFAEIFPSTTETWVHHEIMELTRLGCDVRVFASWNQPEIRTAEEAELASLTRYQDGISALQIPKGMLALLKPRFLIRMIKAFWADPPTPRQGVQWIRDIIRLARFVGEVRQFRPEVTICHFAGTRSNLGLMLQWLDHTPCIIKSHALDVFSGAALFSTKVNEAERFYTISQYNVDFIGAHYPKADASRIRVHTCGVPLDLLPFKPRSIPDDPSTPLLVGVGRLIPMKGFDALLAASRKLLDQGINHRVVLIGEGPEEESLRAQAEELGLSQDVELRGYGTPAEVRASLESAAIFVMPSVWDDKKGTQDGIPVALMESMACGTLTVASRLSGIPELIEDGQSGFLAEPGDSDALTRAIQTALSKTEAEKQEILSQARAVIEDRHDVKKLTQELLNDAETLV